MDPTLQQIGVYGLIPAVTLQEAEDAAALGKALCDGGLPCAEILLRTEAGLDGIRRMLAAFPAMLVGAGTVLSVEQADQAIAAGAGFLMSPGVNPRIIKHCREAGIPIIPGVSTATEIDLARECGLTAAKFFPAEALGGTGLLKPLAAAFAGFGFIPTGGINTNNLRGYMNLPSVLACGGSWMVRAEMICAGNFEEVKRLVKDAVRLRDSIRTQTAGK